MIDKNAHPFVLGLEIYETSRTIRRHFDKRARALGFTQGQCERSAHEPAANQAELFESHGLARGADRVRTNHLVKRTHLLQRGQRVGHRRLTDVAIEVDVEIVFPLA